MEYDSGTDYGARRHEQLRRQQFRRRIRFKKICAISVLVLMFIIVVGAAGGLIYGIYRIVDSKRMVEEPYQENGPLNISLVENMFGEADAFYDSANDTSEYASTVDPMSSDMAGDLLNADDNDTDDLFFSPLVSPDDDHLFLPADHETKTARGYVVVDAGHGGMDCGAVKGEELFEKDINMSIAVKVRDRLLKLGYKVYMTRTDDSFIGLNERATKANKTGADVLVSIHLNSYPDVESVSGIEAWTYKDRKGCPELAEVLSDSVSKATGAKNRGVSFAKNLVVTSKTTMPAVIIECGYISNDREAGLLQTEDYQNKIALSVAEAVDTFLYGSEK